MSHEERRENEFRDQPDATLTVDGLRVTIPSGSGAVEAVRDVSFDLPPNTTLGLLGSSGSGKTVTGLAVMGLPPGGRGSISGGSIRWGGTELTELPEAGLREIRGGEIAMVFQDPGMALTPVHRVGKLLGDTVRAHSGAGRHEIEARTLDLLREVGLSDPAEVAASYVQELSGGMKQRVMIAIALAGEPSVLIADEPTSALDAIARDQILGLIESIQANRGLAVLMISHDLGVLSRMSDRIVVIEEGRTVESADTATLLSHPRHPASAALVASGRAAATFPERARAVPEPVRADPVLRVEGLEKTYPHRTGPAVRDSSLSIAPGEVLGLVGESGCGKTTLARCVLRATEPTGGRIEWEGEDVTHLGDRHLRSRRPRVGSVLQSPAASLNPKRRVRQILVAPLGSGHRGDRELRTGMALESLEAVGLGAELLDRFPAQLSGGQQQRVAIARALITGPRLLVCDEPFTALDVVRRDELAALLKRIQAERGLACLFIAHDLDVIRQIADRVAVMHEGTIVETGPAAAVLAEPREEITRRLVEASARNRTEVPARPPML